jgi:hypothetical protein
MTLENQKRKQDLSLFLNLFIRDNLKFSFSEEKLDAYITKYVEATTKVKTKSLYKLIDEFEQSIIDLDDGFRSASDRKFDASIRPHRFKQYIFNHDALKEVIQERKNWLVKKRMGIKNYMAK